MKKNYTNTFLLTTLNIPIIDTLDSLSNHLSLSTSIVYLLSSKNKDFYSKFDIKKSNGDKRKILAPAYSMKIVQRWILENILYKISVSNEATAYKRGNGNPLINNATIHRNSLYCLVIDIEDFFTSISGNKVYNLFRKIGYNSYISHVFSEICTYDNYLPQGAVTSPYISNLVCFKLDRRLKGYCEKRDINFTRYSDDFVFSSDNKNSLKSAYKTIVEIMKDEGYSINDKKTRYLTPVARKRITGITINDGNIKAPKELKRKVRSMINNSIYNMDYSQNEIIRGYISYINSIENNYREKVKNYILKFNDKDVLNSQDIVDIYSKNKLFTDFPDLTVNGAVIKKSK